MDWAGIGEVLDGLAGGGVGIDSIVEYLVRRPDDDLAVLTRNGEGDGDVVSRLISCGENPLGQDALKGQPETGHGIDVEGGNVVAFTLLDVLSDEVFENGGD